MHSLTDGGLLIHWVVGGWNVSFEWSEVGLAVVTLLGMVYLWFAVLPDWFGWATASLASDLAKGELCIV